MRRRKGKKRKLLSVEQYRDRVRYAPKEIRALVLDRDGFKCRYCGKEVTGKNANIDHVVPWLRGGRTEALNLVTACKACNKSKGNSVWEPTGVDGSVVYPLPFAREILTFSEVDGYMKCDLCSGRVNTGNVKKLRAHRNQLHKTATLIE